MPLTLSDFDYALPPHCIAQSPLADRSASRLLAMNGERLSDHVFSDLPDLLQAGDLLVMNDTRVLHARLFGHKQSGGQVEVLIERILSNDTVLAQLRASKAPKPGSRLLLEQQIAVEVLGREADFYRLRFQLQPQDTLPELIERHGHLPLPPYIQRSAVDSDEARYQTVFARNQGSVAAPTAGLHFDEALLHSLRQRQIDIAYITLHIGAGTFQPVREEDLSRHRMHSECYTLPATTVAAINTTRQRGGRVVAVGTTTMRTLEAAADASGELLAGSGETDLFITPGYRFRVIDRLISNFHLPKSSLLMLVAAFGGFNASRRAYRHAIDQGYRFFSYGDAMLIDRHYESLPI